MRLEELPLGAEVRSCPTQMGLMHVWGALGCCRVALVGVGGGGGETSPSSQL